MECIFFEQINHRFFESDGYAEETERGFENQTRIIFAIDFANLIGAIPREAEELIPRLIPSIDEAMERMGARAIFVLDRGCLHRLCGGLSDKAYAKLSTQLRGENVVLTSGQAETTLLQLVEKMKTAIIVSNDRYLFYSRQFPMVGAGRIARFSVVRIQDVGLMFTIAGVREGIFLPFREERAA